MGPDDNDLRILRSEFNFWWILMKIVEIEVEFCFSSSINCAVSESNILFCRIITGVIRWPSCKANDIMTLGLVLACSKFHDAKMCHF